MFKVTPGVTYTGSAWVRAGATATTYSLAFVWADDSGAYVNSTYSATITETPNTWRNTTMTATAPLGARYGGFYIAWSPVPSGDVHYVDSVKITYPAQVTYVDNIRIAWASASATYARVNTAQQPAIGTDGTNLLVSEYDATNNKIIVKTIDPGDMKTISATMTSNAVTGFAGPTKAVMRSNFDFGSTRTIVKGPGTSAFWVFSGSTYQTNETFPADPGGSAGATWDGTNFWGLGTNNRIYRHTGLVWTDAGPAKNWEAAFTWYDGDATGGNHETSPSPRSVFAMQKRARLLVTGGTIPDYGDPDDPDRIRIYLSQSSGGTLYLQTTTAEGVNAARLTTATFSGTTPPVTSNFAPTTPAQIKNPSGSLVISGDGSVQAERYKGLLGGLETLAMPYVALMRVMSQTCTGGGLLTNTSTGVAWGTRFCAMNIGRHTTYTPAGFFEILVPADGQTIPVYNHPTLTSVTVASGVIPLGTWTTLYYEIPFGSLNTSVPGNFRQVHYQDGTSGNLTVPWNWLPVVTRNGDGANAVTHKWVNGAAGRITGWTADRATLASNYTTTTTVADVGISDTVSVGSTNDVYLVNVSLDVTAATTGQSSFVGRLSVDGTVQNEQFICVNPTAGTSFRTMVSQTYLVTGLAAGSRVFKVQASASTAGNYRVSNTHSTMTITQVK